MAEFSPDIADQVLAACQAGAAEAMSRALDATIQITPGEAASLDLEALPEQLDGPGLVFVLKTGDVAALVLLSESTGLVPEWCASPDATGKSKLTTLAQELGMVLLPEEFMSEDFLAQRVSNLSDALRRGEVATGAGLIPLEITSEEKTGSLYLIWPAAKPAEVLEPEPAAEEQAAEAPEVEEPAAAQQEPEKSSPAPEAPSGSKQPRSRFRNFEAGLQYLPRYSRSLLRITVPVVVTLASKRQQIQKIIELGPGSIIQFDKPCDQMLDLEIGNEHVAVGEAVKVGDKFGLRITSIILPKECFEMVPGKGRE